MEITRNYSHPVSVRNIFYQDILWDLTGNRLPIGGGTRLN